MNDLGTRINSSANPPDNDAPECVTEHDRGATTPHFSELLAKRLDRRKILAAGSGLAITTLFAAPQADASDSELEAALNGIGTGRPVRIPDFNFTAVPVSREDQVTVPAGYSARPLLPDGTPLCGSYPANRGDDTNTGADQEQQVGQHHDGMHFFPAGYGPRGNTHGLLAINHEYIDQRTLHATAAEYARPRTFVDAVRKEIAAHGVSIAEIRKNGTTGAWDLVRGLYNRRVTGATPMAISGPVGGSRWVQTKYSPTGTRVRGTLNNCAHGYTPWGTSLTCEENWAGYFINRDTALPREHARYGVPRGAAGQRSRYGWDEVPGDGYERFDASTKAVDPRQDYRNEPNGFGWVVEIDPWRPNSIPKKRTALGRLAHEGAWIAPPRIGQPIVVYMGDDSQNEYIYKFVTRERWIPFRTNGDCLDEGTLYVARFNEDGSGDWLALDMGSRRFNEAMSAWVARDPANNRPFESQAEPLVNTRLAADIVAATRMDRPEWGAIDTTTGDVYFTLTNNSGRAVTAIDAANPRGPNPFGHIIRWAEGRGNYGKRRRANYRYDDRVFEWDIFVLAGPETDSWVDNARSNSLGPDNIFASPDGLWIGPNRVVWIQTDMSGSQLDSGPFGNNSMLVANPDTGEIKRFLTAVPGCEVTGITVTPDQRTMFVNVQHPGEQGSRLLPNGYSSAWPAGGLARPRSAVVVVTKDNGEVVGT